MELTVIKRLSTLFLAACALALFPADGSCAIGIHNNGLELNFDEAACRFDLFQKPSQQVLHRQINLGSIQIPGQEKSLDINRENFPEMSCEKVGENRLDIVFPSPDKKTTFVLALEIQEHRLWVAFDTKPIEKMAGAGDSFEPEDETLELLQKPAEYTSVTLLPALIALRLGEEGSLVVPYQEGTLIDFSHRLDKERSFNLFENSGLTMPFWGVSTPRHSEVCITDALYMQLRFVPEKDTLLLSPQFNHDPYGRPVRLQVDYLGDGKTYIDAARAYRQYLQDRNELPSLEKKLREKPQLVHLLEGVNVKFPIYMSLEQRPNEQGVTPPPKILNYQTFEDVRDILKDMKSNGVDRLMAIWWGWGKEGYDRLHPDLLPPNPERGGAPVFTTMNREIAELGFAIGFHDNYTDIYEAAPSFENGAHCTVGSDGQNLKGGFWAGGQCWLLCSTEGLKYAQRNFEAMKDLGPLNACFIDVLTAAPLFDCYSPVHPHTKYGDRKNKRAMMELVASRFGVMGTEHGFSWGADLCDYMEGITLDPNNQNDFFSGYGSSVPLFAAVFHDAVLQYMHQGAPVNPSNPDRLLFNLRAGGSSYFNVVRDQYEKPEWKDYFIRASRISSDVIRRTWKTPLTGHRFLNEEKTAEQCQYGEDVTIVINRSEKEFRGTFDRNLAGQSAPDTEIVLAPHGFLVSTPDYAALNGSQWGSLKLDRNGWYTFQTQNGKALSSAKDINAMNYTRETSVNKNPAIQLPKGTSAISTERLLEP